MTRRPFAIQHPGGWWVIKAGSQTMRLTEVEAEELVRNIAGDIITREVARLTGLER
ncbi:hypothetical protein HGK72_30855 [Mycolicibacterium fortuitum]|uniref:hypothetical protein n=1 Tax=Mycolicibacterium fortuitum TaxID=1766 RepID=UPI000A967BF4|nr:hypothetical protein [Mycolicibacterium fortuitum]NOR04444.1 hypothetical protein [Mycolicibacterium fortuitum]